MFLYYVLIFQIEFKKTAKMGQTSYKQSWKKPCPWLSPLINTRNKKLNKLKVKQ